MNHSSSRSGSPAFAVSGSVVGGEASHAVRRKHRGFAAGLLAATLAVAGSPAWADGLPDFRQLVQDKGDSVVSIGVLREALSPTAGRDRQSPPGLDQLPEELRRFFEQDPRGGQPMPGPGRGIGSGFIISADGYVVTNAHVVDGATGVTVTLDDRRELPATVVGADEATDIALLKIDASDLPVAELGDSDQVEVGEWVLAIGSPFGFDHTATQGIVSAVARNLPYGSYTPFIQTDVAVNPGNSGGPLFDVDGVVIGVNSQIYSSSGGYQGLSFAIPINVAKNVVEQLRTTGRASRGWLGVAIQDVDQGLADAFGMDAPAGALVSSVAADGPAASGGIRQGDVIVEFDGRQVDRSGDLPALVGVVSAGDQASVTVLRDGERKTIDVKIGEFATDDRSASADMAPMSTVLGVTVGALDPAVRDELGLEHGVRISKVEPGSPAANAGLLPDDVIVSLDGTSVDDADAFRREVDGLEQGKSVAALVQRGDRPLYVALEVPKA